MVASSALGFSRASEVTRAELMALIRSRSRTCENPPCSVCDEEVGGRWG